MFGLTPELVVVGTFRSGTNAMKTVLDRNYRVSTSFNRYFWKHSLPPHNVADRLPSRTRFIVMTRSPVEFNRSIFRFWHSRRPELSPSNQLASFVHQPFVVYDNTGGLANTRYWFSNPSDYWSRFYYSWCNWPAIFDRVHFVRLEDFETNTEFVLAEIENRFGLSRRSGWKASLPARRVGPSVSLGRDGLSYELESSDLTFITEEARRPFVGHLSSISDVLQQYFL